MNNVVNRISTVIILVLFCAASLALAVHHDDYFFQTVNCSICKIKNANSGTPQKLNTDCNHLAVINLSLLNEFRENSISLTEANKTYPVKKLFSSFANKAPPSL